LSIWSYVVKRLFISIPTLIGVSLLVFFMMHLIPGDPAQLMLYPKGTPEEVEALRQELGLNQSMLSVFNGEPVISEIAERFPATIELTLGALMIAILIGMPLGVLAARKKNSIIDYMCITVSLAGVSIPVFWLGLMMIFFFSATLGVLPVSGRISMEYTITDITGFYLFDAIITGNFAAAWDVFKHMILPALALSTVPLALVVRITRSSMLEVLSQDYMKTAKAKGIPGRLIIYKHALRNALIPVITVLGIQVGSLLGGAILTETVFSWPGIGTLVVSSINERDYPIIQGVVFVIAIIMILVNLLVDVVYAFIDPRIRY